jgi:SAM-dependent methyltransferase
MARVEAAALPGATVLDFGCNRGGFLRWLYDEYQIKQGFGIDPAAGAVERAQSLAAGRPLEYRAGEHPDPDWPAADIAFSHEVMYLIHDLDRHAEDVEGALRPGGTYVAVEGVHQDSAHMARWHGANMTRLGMPPLRAIKDYIAPFIERGFGVEVGILPVAFLPVLPDELEDVAERLHYWTSEKAVFRYTRREPGSGSSGRASHVPSSQWD